ncbi:MAG: type II secretion system GspH family protein [Synergistaceae bacterium]|nr:type II secretion system GspH family protein [Synergistaceae bacterium]
MEKGRILARREGFTLVELVVSMVIIAILVGVMMLAYGGGDAIAEATAILNDLRLMKASAILFVQEHGGFLPQETTNHAELLGKYMDHGRIINEPVRYAFIIRGGFWWVGVKIKGKPRVYEIVEAKAAEAMPLYGSDDIEVPPLMSTREYIYKKSHVAVWARVR